MRTRRASAAAGSPAGEALYRWIVLAIGTAGQAAFAAVLWGIPALAPSLRHDYRLSLSQTGVVLASVSLGVSVGALPWGALADVLGGRRVTALGLGGAAASLAAAAASTSFPELVACLTAAGATGTGAIPATGRAVMGWFAARERGLALGIRQTGVTVGAFASAVVLPAVLRADGLHACFLTLAAACAATAVAAGAGLRERAAPGRREPPLRATAREGPLRDRRIWAISLSGMLILPAQVIMAGFVVLFLHETRGFSIASGGLVLAGIQLLGGTLRIATGHWSDRLGTRVVPLRRVTLAISAAVALVALVEQAPTAVLVVVLIAAGGLSLSWNGLVFTAVAEAAGRDRSGMALGLQQTGVAIAGTAAPIVLTQIIGASSWRMGFAFGAACPLAARMLLRGAVRRV